MYRRLFLPFPHENIVIERDNGDGTKTCFNNDHTEMYSEFLEWNEAQAPENKIDLSHQDQDRSIHFNLEPEDEKEFTPAERKALRELLKNKS